MLKCYVRDTPLVSIRIQDLKICYFLLVFDLFILFMLSIYKILDSNA
jgi:hypothetical protein